MLYMLGFNFFLGLNFIPLLYEFAYKTLNFTQNDMCATSDKKTNFNISKNLLFKVGISYPLCSRTV